MKIEKKTSAEIEWWLFNQSENNPTRNKHYRKLMEDKQWVSVEDLIEFVESYQILYDRNEIGFDEFHADLKKQLEKANLGDTKK